MLERLLSYWKGKLFVLALLFLVSPTTGSRQEEWGREPSVIGSRGPSRLYGGLLNFER